MFDGPSRLETASAERNARQRLARTSRIGPTTFHEALAHFGSATVACRELGRDDKVEITPKARVAEEERLLTERGGRFLVFGDDDYPPQLAALPDAPPLLSVVGDGALLGRPMLAIVGARDASLAGRRLAQEFACDLGAAGFAIVSGLARGIDAAAHEAALASGTVAVMAGGVDQVYPPQNTSLYEQIARTGLLLSEVPLGAPSVARAFPRRNRIVSGLAAGVIVIEAAERSGSLITAQRAAEQGRDVLVVPGSPRDPRYTGSNSLIRDGAILVRDVNDILSVFSKSHRAVQVPVKPREKSGNRDTAKVLHALGSEPTAVDELVRRCQVSAAAVAEVLLALELEGRLERHRGNRVSLI